MKAQHSGEALELNDISLSSIDLEEAMEIPLPDDKLSCHDASAKGSHSPTSHDSDVKDNLKGDEVMDDE